MMYTAALAFRHVGFLRVLNWRLLVALSFIPTLAFVLFPEA